MTPPRWSDVRRIVRWSRSREGRNCFIAALLAGLLLGFYRNEPWSVASTADAASQVSTPANVLAERASVRPLSPAPIPRPSPPAPARSAPPASPERAVASDSVPGVEPRPPAPRKGSARAADRRLSAAKKKLGKKRRAKRLAKARAAKRGARHAKAERATKPGPLNAWIAARSRSEDSSKPR
jgi:hypothetical protein